MSDVLLDASALLALLHEEPGLAVVQAVLPVAAMSAVNALETMAVLARRLGADAALASFRAFRLPILPFTAEQAEHAQALLWRHKGALSLADCACIATAGRLGLPVLTGDRIWATLPLGIEVRLIRP